jgi:hypothetical protein
MPTQRQQWRRHLYPEPALCRRKRRLPAFRLAKDKACRLVARERRRKVWKSIPKRSDGSPDALGLWAVAEDVRLVFLRRRDETSCRADGTSAIRRRQEVEPGQHR